MSKKSKIKKQVKKTSRVLRKSSLEVIKHLVNNGEIDSEDMVVASMLFNYSYSGRDIIKMQRMIKANNTYWIL